MKDTLRVLEEISKDIWGLLTAAHHLDVRLGEETLTDLASLQLSRARPAVQVRMLPKRDEAVLGADWDWWVGSSTSGWVRILIQAKKLFLPDATYRHLRHKVADDGLPEFQFDRLEAYASAKGALAYYCFFNGGVDYPPATPAWGCTLAKLEDLRSAHAKRGARDFFSIHGNGRALPWHNVVRHWDPSRDSSLHRHASLPEWVTEELKRPDAGNIAQSMLAERHHAHRKIPYSKISPGEIGPIAAAAREAATSAPKPKRRRTKKDFSARTLVVLELKPD